MPHSKSLLLDDAYIYLIVPFVIYVICFSTFMIAFIWQVSLIFNLAHVVEKRLYSPF